MPSKKAQADAAFERQEDQRALAKVIAAAYDFEQQYGGNDPELIAAIERAKRAFLSITGGPIVPRAHDVLPGQLAIDGTVAGEPIREMGNEMGNPMAEAFDVPKQCPCCCDNMLLVWGGSWTPLRTLDDEYQLQCGSCGHRLTANERQYDAVVAERKRTVGASDKKSAPKPGREGMGGSRRTRGAG